MQLRGNPELNTYRLRIQPFSNAFVQFVRQEGIPEDAVSDKQAREFIGNHRYVAEFFI
jgi:hypothetical protein